MIRILFVDDDSNVIQAMRRSMHCMRNEWDMEFASSGPEALQRLAVKPADVIVTDMRMPGMDGWQLLAEVKSLYPQTVRLVLSGYAEPGAIMRLVGTAHQYIAKPGDSEVLKTAIAQTQLMRGLLNSEAIAAMVGNVGTLPSFPKAFEEISSCLKQPSATVTEAALIIGRDVAMTANIMKLVNSAFFGARRQVTSVERAVAFLGLDTLTALVLGHGLFQSGGSNATEALWSHSLRTATAARAIALHERLSAPRVDEAFLTGMLHDVGRVVFAGKMGETGGTDLSSNADTMMQVDKHHAAVGAYLLGLWGFPSHVVAAVALHHTPGQRADAGFDLTAIVHIADRLVHMEFGGNPEAGELGIEPGLLEPLGLVDHLLPWSRAINQLEVQQTDQKRIRKSQ